MNVQENLLICWLCIYLNLPMQMSSYVVKKGDVYWPYFARTGCTGRTRRGPLCSLVSCRTGCSKTGSWAGRAVLTWREHWRDPPDPWCGPCVGCSWRPCHWGAPGRLSGGRWRSRFGAGVARRLGSADPSPDFQRKQLRDVKKKTFFFCWFWWFWYT